MFTTLALDIYQLYPSLSTLILSISSQFLLLSSNCSKNSKKKFVGSKPATIDIAQFGHLQRGIGSVADAVVKHLAYYPLPLSPPQSNLLTFFGSNCGQVSIDLGLADAHFRSNEPRIMPPASLRFNYVDCSIGLCSCKVTFP